MERWDALSAQRTLVDWMSSGDRRPTPTLRSVVSLAAKRFSVLWEKKSCRLFIYFLKALARLLVCATPPESKRCFSFRPGAPPTSTKPVGAKLTHVNWAPGDTSIISKQTSSLSVVFHSIEGKATFKGAGFPLCWGTYENRQVMFTVRANGPCRPGGTDLWDLHLRAQRRTQKLHCGYMCLVPRAKRPDCRCLRCADLCAA